MPLRFDHDLFSKTVKAADEHKRPDDVGLALIGTALLMKPAHRAPGLAVARRYCLFYDLDADALEASLIIKD